MIPDRAEITDYRRTADAKVEEMQVAYNTAAPLTKMIEAIPLAYAQGIRDALKFVDQGKLSRPASSILGIDVEATQLVETGGFRDSPILEDTVGKGKRLSEVAIGEFKDRLEARRAGYAARAAKLRGGGLPDSIDSIFPFTASLMAKAGIDAIGVADGKITMELFLAELDFIAREEVVPGAVFNPDNRINDGAAGSFGDHPTLDQTVGRHRLLFGDEGK